MKPILSSYQTKNQLKKVMWITIFWILVSALQYANGYATLNYFDHDLSGIDATQFLIGSLITGLTAGLLGGSSMVFFWEKWLRTKSYRRSLFYILLTYSMVYILVGIISLMYSYSMQMDVALFSPVVFANLRQDLENFSFLYSYLFWLVVVLITLIALLVNDKYGPGVFLDFLMGKYFHPRREARIFMFLDLRGSTAIAEQLGEVQYFNFLKEVYKDITPSILRTQGEVYQYVGDEIVISWSPKSGYRNTNVLHCFFDIQESLLAKSAYYRANYNGLQPEFKAGLHLGNVMAGEIGVLKRDIAYSGDVLNTTARIQAKCNELGVNILISKYLIEFLTPVETKFQPVTMGEYPLRGKQSNLHLYTLKD
ncbi:MAG: adenylate/guanylate cyclase domain-containing protein [Flavobacteriaceae bacterium]